MACGCLVPAMMVGLLAGAASAQAGPGDRAALAELMAGGFEIKAVVADRQRRELYLQREGALFFFEFFTDGGKTVC
ncbi:MAG: hypothetical protein AAFR44_11145, partial [Pseudomonadota bacterium]